MPVFDRYQIRVFGGPNGLGSLQLRAVILLSDGSVGQARIRFHREGAPIATDSETSTGVILMHLPEARFDAVVDLLRSEGPWFVTFSSGVALLGTGVEPIGEEET